MTMSRTIVTIILILSNFAQNIALEVPENGGELLSYYVSQIINYDNNNNSLIAYYEDDNINQIIRMTKSTNVIVDMKKDERETCNFYTFSMYVIVIQEVNEFNLFFERCSHSSYWNPHGRILVVYSGKDDIDIMLKIAWRKYIININIMLINKEPLDIYTYYPYKNGNCGNNISKELLGKCGKYPIDEIYPKKIPQTVNGCLTTVAINPFDPYTMTNDLYTDNSTDAGFENVLIGNLLRKINATVKIIPLNGKRFNNRFPNGTFIGPVSYIHSGQCDMVYGHLWTNFFYLDEFDITYPYFYDQNTWFVPRALPGAQWQSLFLIFEGELWLTLSLMLLFNILVWWSFGRYIREMTEWRDLSWCTVYSYSSLVMVSFRLPKNVILRLVVICWVITCWLVASAYQSKLLSILTKPVYEKQITTLEELVASDYKIVHFGSLYTIPESLISETEKQVVKKGVFVTLKEHMSMTKNISNTGFTAHSLRIRYNARKYHTYPDGTPKLYELDKAISFGAIAMFASKGYPFMQRFDELVLWIWQSGLTGKWIKDTDQSYKNIKPSTTIRKLNLNHFMGAYYLLIFGLLLAMLVFIIELLIVKKKMY